MNRLVKTLLWASPGIIVGCIVSMIAERRLNPLYAISFMGIPAGWHFYSKHTGHTLVFGNSTFVAVWWMLKILLCTVTGWALLFVDIVRGIIEIVNRKNNVIEE